MIKIFAMVSMLVLSACAQVSSNDVDPSTVNGSITVERDGASSLATVSTVFFVGGPTGTVMTVDSPASITVDGQNCTANHEPVLNMTTYGATVNAAQSSTTVVYTDKNGQPYSNQILIPGALSMSVPSGTVSIAQGFTLSFTTDKPFVAGQELQVTLASSTGSSFQSYPLLTNATTGSQLISSASLQGLALGNVSVSACVVTYPTPQAPFPKGTTITSKACVQGETINLGM